MPWHFAGIDFFKDVKDYASWLKESCAKKPKKPKKLKNSLKLL